MPAIIEPTIANPAELIAIAGAGPFSLGITQPTESGGATLTVTIDSVPSYGTVQYLNGGTWTDVTVATVLTPSQLASLRYIPPASGEDTAVRCLQRLRGTSFVSGARTWR